LGGLDEKKSDVVASSLISNAGVCMVDPLSWGDEGKVTAMLSKSYVEVL
jgi:hypothetical protein